MDISNILKTTKDIIKETNEVTPEKQNGFLQSTIGKIINSGLNLGLRALLPDLIEDQVINIKDALLNGGIKEGISTAVQSAIDLGKSAIGLFTGKFETVSQASNAIKTGGLIDNISSLIDNSVKYNIDNKVITDDTARLIKGGKNVILNTIERNIEDNFTAQLKGVEKLGKYASNWNKYYEEKDFDGMQREYSKMQETLKTVLPMETTLQEARRIENLHLLIKNKGKDFNLTEEELKLASKLTT